MSAAFWEILSAVGDNQYGCWVGGTHCRLLGMSWAWDHAGHWVGENYTTYTYTSEKY